MKNQHSSSKKIGVFNFFRQKLAGGKLSAPENFSPGQLRRFQCSLAISKWILQIRLQKKSVKIKKTPWAMGNVDSVLKKFKNISSFSDENWPENYFRHKLFQHAAQMIGIPSVNVKILANRSLLSRQDSKIYHLPSKKFKNLIYYR